ncbi:hypothetical protein BDW02DRAFT_283410 [Decorospora gaudefroyi]|uniref:Uncharacterized protein n=1 Tax=Decorospora gaudefroyi TaxID=184978 RepID=A0A6A5KDZ3_9PLEO|nr:hypothetical protein BDW02DRAFT_283410 [Decorospora gaudefroyi]
MSDEREAGHAQYVLWVWLGPDPTLRTENAEGKRGVLGLWEEGNIRHVCVLVVVMDYCVCMVVGTRLKEKFMLGWGKEKKTLTFSWLASGFSVTEAQYGEDYEQLPSTDKQSFTFPKSAYSASFQTLDAGSGLIRYSHYSDSLRIRQAYPRTWCVAQSAQTLYSHPSLTRENVTGEFVRCENTFREIQSSEERT